MKKYNLFKVIAITVFVAWLITLFIPGSYVDYSGNVTQNAIAGTGIWGIFSNMSISISYFNGIAVFLVAVACFYAILSKISVYDRFVKKVASVFNGKERLLVIISIIVFGLLAMIVSDFMILITFIPFVYQVMRELKIDKKVILSSTIISGIVGSMFGIYNSTLFNMFSIKLNTLLLVKVILLVISLIILIIFAAPKKLSEKSKKESLSKKNDAKTSKKALEKKENNVKKVSSKKVNKVVYAVLTILFGTIGINKFYAGKIKEGILCILFSWTLIPTILSIAEFITVLTEKADKNGEIEVTTKRRENVLFATGLIIFILFVIGSTIPWESLINKFTSFTDFNKWLSEIKIGGYGIFSNIIGSPIITDSTTGSSSGVINAFGSWAMSDISILLFILTFVIALISKIKFDDFISTITDGIKKILPVAITAMLISIVLVIMVTTGVNVTITNFILSLTKGFNIVTSTLAAMIGSILTGDFYYFTSTIGTVYAAVITNSNYYGVVAFILQSIFYLMMIIAPTSVGLIIGLYYLDIPYNKWFKFIWKFLLVLFIVIIVTSIILFVLV